MNAHQIDLWPPVKKLVCLGQSTTIYPSHGQLLGVPPAIAEAEGFASGEILGQALLVELPPQAYRLTLGSASASQPIVLEYGDEQGLRYGLRTLQQILASGADLNLLIEDAPAIATRAIMVDISRDRVPTMAEFFRIIDQAAALKANHVQLYIEHSFAYKNHSSVWQDASPITAQELLQIDAKAQSRGIVLSLCQNMFGHMERWLKHPAYQELGNFDHIAERLKTENGPFSFNPAHPKSVSLPLELGAELRPLLSAGLLNFGGDETVDLGKGRSSALVQERGLSTVYGEHLASLAQGLAAQGWKLQFWADIALEFPDALKLLPPSLTALAWGYESSSDFEIWGKNLRQLGFDWWACPGTSAWRSLVGRRDARSGSIATALSAAMRYGASGFMVTDWGDLGHRHTPAWAWLGWSEGLGCAWSGKAEVDWTALSRWTFPQWPSSTAAWMDEVSAYESKERQGKVHPLRGGQLINSSLVFVDSILPWAHRTWLDELDLWESLAQKINSFKSPVHDGELLFPLEQLSWLAERAILRRMDQQEMGKASNIEIKNININKNINIFKSRLHAWRQEGQRLIERHRELWRQTSREGGLDDSVHQFHKLILGAPEA